MQSLLGLCYIILFVFIYILPTFVANKRRHNDVGAICILNILLGWIGIFWIVSLIWATTGNIKK